MPFQHISSLTAQISALDGSDNFNYIMALQDICSRLESGKPKLFRLKRGKRRRKRKKPIKPKEPEKEESGWFNWDLFGLFTDEADNSNIEEEKVQEFSFLDPFGLFSSSDAAMEKADFNEYDYYYDYDYYDDNRAYFLS